MRLVRALLNIRFQDRSQAWLLDPVAGLRNARDHAAVRGNSVMPTYQLTRRLLPARLELYLLATALSICATVAVGIVPSSARAASPYTVDGVALGASFK